jgi:6-phosphogluconolactonase (cycloisomerase 2 family)
MKFTYAGLMATLAASASALPHVARSSYPVPSASAAGSSPARILLGNSGHIYVADFTPKTGKFELSIEQEIVGGNSWMAFVAPNLLYAVDENSNELRLFELDLKANKLKLKTKKTGSTGVVHLEFNPDKTRLVGAAYGNGTIDVWNTENSGLEFVKTLKSPGKLGPDEERQDASHPHQANLDPSGRYFAVNDLGTDSVVLIDSKDDAYKIAKNIPVKAGCGPRHGVFYPSGSKKATHYIVACELSNQALVYSVSYEQNTLAFKHYQSISTYGKDAPAKDIKKAAVGEIILAPNNKDVYISNRVSGQKTDSIAHFTIAECGTLTYAETVSSGGLLPRMMSFSLTGKHIFVGNQDGTNGLVALKRSPDGKLTEKPVATLPGSAFGEAQFGPQYVQQIV